MPNQGNNVFHKAGRLTETDFRAIVADIIRRLEKNHSRERIALEAGCDVRTIDNALTGKCSIKAHTLFNLMALDMGALDDLTNRFGGHVVAHDATLAPDMQLLADTGKLVAIHAAALSDGRIDHREAAVLADACKPVVQGWAGFVARKAVA